MIYDVLVECVFEAQNNVVTIFLELNGASLDTSPLNLASTLYVG